MKNPSLEKLKPAMNLLHGTFDISNAKSKKISQISQLPSNRFKNILQIIFMLS